jgi:hypothetical protein
MKKILLSGVKPTGRPHIGNYFGAMKQFADLQTEYEVYIMIADYHALNFIQDKKEMQTLTEDLVKDYLAIGLDNVTIFKQSDIDTYLIRRGEMDATFKKEDPDVTLQITKQNITGKASIKDVIANGKGEIELSGDFLIKKTFKPSFLCEKLAALPLKELTSLSSSGELLAPYINDIQVHIFPPWLFTKPSLKRFHCGFSR